MISYISQFLGRCDYVEKLVANPDLGGEAKFSGFRGGDEISGFGQNSGGGGKPG